MAIIDMKKGNKNIVRAYKNNVVIFERGEYFIQSTINYANHEIIGGYIPISDMELYSDYKYEVDVEFNAVDYTLATLIGGSNTDAGGYGKGASCGFFLGSFEVSSVYWSGERGVAIIDNDHLTYPWGYEIHSLPNCIEEFDHESGEPPILPQRKVFTFYNPSAEPWQVNTLTGRDKLRMTTGGFYLLGGRCGLDTPPTAYDTGYTGISPFYRNFGKVYRISIYDNDGVTLLKNFLPKEQDNHKGMVDTISGTFYPCDDDSKFIIDKEA